MKKEIAAAVALAALLGFLAGAAGVWWLGARSASLVALILGGLALASAIGVAGVLFARRLVAPLDRLAERAGEVAEGEYSLRLDVTGPLEVQRLEDRVNAMAEKLIEHRDRLRENVESLESTNRALIRARDELLHAEKLASVGRLAAEIAHEVGNPLSSILSVVDLLRSGHDDQLVDHVESEARRIDEIINGLLDFASPGEAPVTATDPSKVVRQTIELLEVQGRFADVSVSVEDATDGRQVQANPDRLQQVLVNLLLNAADAVERDGEEAGGEERGRAVRVRIGEGVFDRGEAIRDFSPRRSDDPEGIDYRHLRRVDAPPGQFREPPLAGGDRVVRIEVLDTGPGLGGEREGRIFDPFFTTQEPGEGMGLGLAIAARLTDQMGGLVQARERSEGGSCFTVVLPAADGE